MVKQQILRELEETGLLAGVLVNQALLANDRAKYFLTLIQLAFEQARDPRPEPETLADERYRLDLDEPAFDAVVTGARLDPQGEGVHVPSLGRILEELALCCRTMLEPIVLASAPEAVELSARLETLAASCLERNEGAVSERWLDTLTRGTRGGDDTLHLYVMDAHRVLNRVQGQLAETQVDGVPVVAMDEGDRPLIQAFVRGVRRTAPLKFDHPGLGTTAGRYAGRLVLQNDVGVTDSHVIVIAVTGDAIEITYTDLHARRLAFFRRLLASLRPAWKQTTTRSSTELEEGEQYFLLNGAVHAAGQEEKERALERIGSRLVFLIDWNKARKRLRNFMPNKAAQRVLDWAAASDTGHMALLKAGGEELIYQALDVAAADHLRYGEPFYSAVGTPVAVECFCDILRVCHEGVTQNQTPQVVRDRVVSILSLALTRKAPAALHDCQRQAALVVEASLSLQHTLRHLSLGGDGAARLLARSQRRVTAWENEADAILNQLRRTEARRPSQLPVRELSGAVDDAMDCLERGMFFLAAGDGAPERLTALSGVLVRCAQEFYKGLAILTDGAAEPSRDDLPEFFESVGRLDTMSRRKDELERDYLRRIFDLELSAGQIERWREIGSQLALAVDHLARAAFLLYDSVFQRRQVGG